MTKKFTWLLIAFLAMGYAAMAQQQETPEAQSVPANMELMIKRGDIYLNGIRLTLKQAENIIATDPDALRVLRSGKGLWAGGVVLGGIGGFAAGFGTVGLLGSSSVSKGSIDSSMTQAYVGMIIGGGVVIIGGVIMSGFANKKIRKSVKMYNGGLKPVPELSFGITPSGNIGLSYTF